MNTTVTRLKNILPKSGAQHWAETSLTWSGVGLLGALLANFLDNNASLSYAAYYTNAVNDAVGYNFWILLAVIGLLLFFLCLPLIYLCFWFPQLQWLTDQLRRFAYTFFLVAFDEGGLMIGILLANMLHTSNKLDMLASRSFLLSDIGLISILGLLLSNAVLWLLGESLYNPQDKSYSGVVNVIIQTPLKYLAPLYLSFTSCGLYLIINQ
jgi:hypothetical protein